MNGGMANPIAATRRLSAHSGSPKPRMLRSFVLRGLPGLRVYVVLTHPPPLHKRGPIESRTQAGRRTTAGGFILSV